MEKQESNVATKENMEELYKQSMKKIEPHTIVKGEVMKIDSEGAYISLGAKTEAFLPSSEFTPDSIKEKDIINVYVMPKRTKSGQYVVSKRRADLELSKKKLQEVFEKGETIQATVIDRVKGGILVDIGIRGFVPNSHISAKKVPNLQEYIESLIGEELTLKIIELDLKNNKAVLSRRLVQQEEFKKKEQEIWENIYEGQIREGIVKRLEKFGAFVDIGGIDGLVHISEIAWRNINHPSDVLKEGDKIKVMVLSFDKEKRRISLSLKQAYGNPWEEIAKKIKEGDKIKGKVIKIAKKYAFVNVYEGIDGVVPVEEIKENNINEGDEIEVIVKILQPQKRRLVLSLTQAKEKQQTSYKTKNSEPTIKDALSEDILDKFLQ